MGYVSSFSLKINSLESFLLKGFVPIPYPLDNCFTIIFFFILSLGIWVSPTQWLVTFGMAVSITLGLQLQVQTRVYLSKFLFSPAKADGSDDPKCSRLQQLATERQLNKFRPLYLAISFLPFSLLLLRLSLLKAHFKVKIINYTLYTWASFAIPLQTMKPWLFKSNSADWLLKIASLCHLMSFTYFQNVCDIS